MTTKPTGLKNPTDSKIDSLLAKTKITLEDIHGLTRPEIKRLEQKMKRTLLKLKGEKKDEFSAKIDLIISPNTKNEMWEYNHAKITAAIAEHMQYYGEMPIKNTIVEVTGLSRQTVTKHINTYKTSPEFVAQMEQFKFMAPKILSHVFRFASQGDMRAARLYFEMIGALNKPATNTVVNKQNNYLQINNTILSQENLKQLSPEQLTQIENIVREKECKRIS